MNSDLVFYSGLLTEIKDRISQAQARASLSANMEMILMYWDIGRMIHQRQQMEGWGAGIIPRLAKDIRNELPELKGFSERSLADNVPKRWLIRKYWMATGQKWVFSVASKTSKGKRIYQAVRLSSMGIRRYVKVKADANPYMSEYGAYFHRRLQNKESRLLPALSAREYRAMAA